MMTRQGDDLAAGDVSAARAALRLPSRGRVAVWVTNSESSRCSVSYLTEQGDPVTAKRPMAAFRAACAHIGLGSSPVRRVTFDTAPFVGGTVFVQRGDSFALDTTRHAVPSFAAALKRGK